MAIRPLVSWYPLNATRFYLSVPLSKPPRTEMIQVGFELNLLEKKKHELKLGSVKLKLYAVRHVMPGTDYTNSARF